MKSHMVLFFIPLGFLCSSCLVFLDTYLKEELFGKFGSLTIVLGSPFLLSPGMLKMNIVCLLTREKIISRSVLA